MSFQINFQKILSSCNLCPHNCNSNRTEYKKGFCGAGPVSEVESYMPHLGEEPEISGDRGSGTIFFSRCNMRCIYCQNFQISQEIKSSKTIFLDTEKLAGIMLELQKKGCHNINLVSPTIWVANIAASLDLARKNLGLEIPAVYNTGGYEKPETIKMLKGIIQIYMPDMRYASNTFAFRYSGIKNYVHYNRESVKQMYEQVGNLELDEHKIAKKGLMIRLLVLPNNISEVKKSLDFIKNELSNEVYVSIMSQYYPLYKARLFPEINRRINLKEYMGVIRYAEKLGFSNGSFQDFTGIVATESDPFTPDFSEKEIFGFNKK